MISVLFCKCIFTCLKYVRVSHLIIELPLGRKIQKEKNRPHPYKGPDMDKSSNAPCTATGRTDFVTGPIDLKEAPLESDNELENKRRSSSTKRPSELFRIEATPQSVIEYPEAEIMNLENKNAEQDIVLLKIELKKWEKSMKDLKYDDLVNFHPLTM